MKQFLVCLTLIISVLLCVVVVHAETCEYNTNWGKLTLGTHNGKANGYWPQGTVSGFFEYPNINGVWVIDGGGNFGNFSFTLYEGGYSGQYKMADDRNWRGEWSGTLIRCY